jgi:hypothetical protein
VENLGMAVAVGDRVRRLCRAIGRGCDDGHPRRVRSRRVTVQGIDLRGLADVNLDRLVEVLRGAGA